VLDDSIVVGRVDDDDDDDVIDVEGVVITSDNVVSLVVLSLVAANVDDKVDSIVFDVSTTLLDDGIDDTVLVVMATVLVSVVVVVVVGAAVVLVVVVGGVGNGVGGAVMLAHTGLSRHDVTQNPSCTHCACALSQFNSQHLHHDTDDGAPNEI